MNKKSKFSGFLGAIANWFKSPFQQAFDRRKAKKGPVNNQPRMRLGTDPYPHHRHKSVAEKERISKFLESRRRRVIAVGTNHDRVVTQRAQRQGITVDEYKVKYQS